MIRAVCLNPVIDRTYYIERFEAAKKYFEISPQLCVGGKGVNIARVMGLMGEPCIAYGFTGGHYGKMVEEEMASFGVEFKALRTEGETRTTINIIDQARHRETEITEPGVRLGPERQKEFLDLLGRDLERGDLVICAGIPMKGMDDDIYAVIGGLCQRRGCRCVLDTTGIYLKRSYPGNYYFSKPNFSELCELFGCRGDENLAAILEYGQQMRRMGTENVLVSLGADGAIFLGTQEILRVRIPRIEAVSTIGSGDASVAGFCIGTSRGMETADCVRLAMACGISNASFSKVGVVDPKQVWEYYGQVECGTVPESEKLKR